MKKREEAIREKELESQFKEFIQTDKGRRWADTESRYFNKRGDFKDYMNSFYPERIN